MRPTTSALFLAAILICASSVYSIPCQAQTRWRHGHAAPQMGTAPHAGHVYLVPVPTHGGYAAPAAKPPYAYGWFGVSPRRHRGVHHGYYHNYTQWSYR